MNMMLIGFRPKIYLTFNYMKNLVLRMWLIAAYKVTCQWMTEWWIPPPLLMKTQHQIILWIATYQLIVTACVKICFQKKKTVHFVNLPIVLVNYPTSTRTFIGRFKSVRSVWAGHPRRTLFLWTSNKQMYPLIVVNLFKKKHSFFV